MAARDLRAAGPERESRGRRGSTRFSLRAARFEVARRRPTLPHLRGDELDDIANRLRTTRS